MHYAASQEQLQKILKKAWLTSSLIFGLCLYWIVYPVHYYGSLNWFLALPCPLLLGMYLGIYPTLFVLGSRIMIFHLPWFIAYLGSAALWTALEYARNSILTGFPWLGLSQAFAPWTWAIQSLRYIGAFVFSGLLVLLTAFLLLAFQKKAALLPAFCLLTGILIPAFLHGPGTTKPGPGIGLIQGNIPQDQKWEPDFQNTTLQTYLDLSSHLLQKEKPKLLIWPETALPFYLQLPSSLSRKVREFVRQNKILLLTGTPGFKREENKFLYYNRACLLNRQGTTINSYDKTHLVPFGEYIPLRPIFPWISRLVPGQGDFAPGREHNPLQVENLALGILICYEVIFPEIAQKEVHNQANLLINISNDGWFGPTSAPRQHLNQAVLRAVEQDRFLLRATNTGISAIIGPQGQVFKKSVLFTKQTLFWPQVQLRKKQTFFSRHFWQIKWISIVLAFALFAWSGVIHCKKKINHSPKKDMNQELLQLPELKKQAQETIDKFDSLWRRL